MIKEDATDGEQHHGSGWVFTEPVVVVHGRIVLMRCHRRDRLLLDAVSRRLARLHRL